MMRKTPAAVLPAALMILAVPALSHAQSFGSSVAAAGQEMLVGEPISQYAPGRVNLYRLQGGSWKKTGELKAPEGHPMDRFGRSLSVDDDRLLVGATTIDDSTRGGGFIFERDRGGNWQLVTRLAPAAAGAGDSYGRAVLLKGDEAYLAAWGANEGRGAVAVWRRDRNGQWAESPSLSAGDAAPGSFFGSSLAIDGNRMAVGSAQRDTSRGTVYVFTRERPASPWMEEARLRPDSLARFASFGSATLFLGDELLAAAPGADSGRGVVFIYGKDGAGQWAVTGRLVPSQREPGAQFGSHLRMIGAELWVGAPGANRSKGAIYRLTRGGDGRWTQVGMLEAKGGEEGDSFGAVFAATSDHALVGLPNDDFGAGTAAFATRRGREWSVSDKTWTTVQGLDPMVGSKRNCSDGRVGSFECQDVSLLAYLPVSEIGGSRGIRLNDVWGWTDPTTNREYALVGRIDGTSFVDVTDPVNPRYIGSLPKTDSSPASTWRDIKVYRDHAFIVADGAQAHGMQVFDLARLRNAGSTPQSFRPDTTYHRIHSAHNIVIDTLSGFAFAVGASSGGETCGGALHMIDIREPKKPAFAGCFADNQTGIQKTGYTHDAQCLVYQGPDSAYRGRQICINSSETAIGIADVTEKANPKAISHAPYPNVGYTHQGWLSEDQRYFYVNDEGDEVSGTVEGTRTLIWDIADLDDPVLAAQYIADNKASDHNLYIKGNLMYQSNYNSGLRILDISDPVKPRLVAHLDTTPTGEDTPGFDGSWSNYPYFKSGTIVVTSIAEGLFLVQGPVSAPIP
jgi:choice-of-anchor B domain-containing protein